MNFFDLVLAVMLVIFTLIGAWQGMVREVISALTWVIAGVLARLFAGQLSSLFTGLLDDSTLRHLLAFVLIFVVVFILCMVASWLVHKYLPPKRIWRIANISLGGVIGAARGAAIVIAVFLIAGLTSFPQRPWWRAATFSPFFERSAVYVASYLPRDIARHIRYG